MTANDLMLPPWAEQMRQKHLSGAANLFILHRNIHDRQLFGQRDCSLTAFVAQALAPKQEHVLELSLDRGITCPHPDKPARNLLAAAPPPGEVALPALLQLLEKHLLTAGHTALIIPYANAIIPANIGAAASLPERCALTTLHRWSLDTQIERQNNVIILLTEILRDLHPALLCSPKVAAIEIPLPDRHARERAITHYASAITDEALARLAEQTAGLSNSQIASLLINDAPESLSLKERTALIAPWLQGANTAERARRIATVSAGKSAEEIRALLAQSASHTEPADTYQEMLALVSQRKREMIEKSCAGLVEFIEPTHKLDAIGGNQAVKEQLRQIATALRTRDSVNIPAGLLAVGPTGAGKTFLIRAFAAESGLPAITLKNFRDRGSAATESMLERALATIRAMGPIIVILDEGERNFGRRAPGTDDTPQARCAARIKDFMSDVHNRGQVLFVLMTNRPDLLDDDIKRPGRLDRKIPFFYAESALERGLVMHAVLCRFGAATSLASTVALDAPTEEIRHQLERLHAYSNADLHALTLSFLALVRQQGFANTPQACCEVLRRAIDDYIPNRDLPRVRYMELLAVTETSRRSMLPARLRDISAEALQAELATLRGQLYPPNQT